MKVQKEAARGQTQPRHGARDALMCLISPSSGLLTQRTAHSTAPVKMRKGNKKGLFSAGGKLLVPLRW